MYGLYSKLLAKEGKRSEFVSIMQRAAALVAEHSGCFLYTVNEDLEDDTCLWIYEAWDSEASHDESLKDSRVRALISEAIPLMGGQPEASKLNVVGGHGL